MIKSSDSILEIANKRIDPSKTTENSLNTNGTFKVTEFYDHDNNIVKKITESIDTTIVLAGARTEIFDIENNIILEKNQDTNNVIWYLTLLEYDNGQLIVKTTFDFTEIYKLKYVIGKGKKETYSIFYNTNGVVVKPNELQKREKPYVIN